MDLKLTITADASDAKAELASVERGIEKVEGASNKAAPSVKSVVDALTGQGAAADKVTQASSRLEETTRVLTGQQAKQVDTTKLSGAEYLAYQQALNKVHMEQKAAEGTARANVAIQKETAAAVGTSRAAMLAYGGAIAAGGAILLTYIGIVASSTKHYFDHAEATKDSRDALEDLAATWEVVQNTIGGAVLGENFSIVKPIDALNAALLVTAGRFVQMAAQARIVLALLERMPGFSSLSGLGDLFTKKGDFDSQTWAALNERFGTGAPASSSPFLNPFAPTPGPFQQFGPTEEQAWQLFLEGEREAERMEREAIAIAKRRAQEIADFNRWLAGLGGIGTGGGVLGFPGGLPGTELGVPTVPEFPFMPLPTSGLPGGLPGSSVSIAAAPMYVDPFREAFAELGRDLPGLIFGALTGSAVHVASAVGAVFAAAFARALASAPRDSQGRPILTSGQQAAGLVGMGLSAFTGGFGIGAQTNRATGVLGGAGQGFAQGATFGSVVPGIGTVVGGLIGAGIGAIGGFFGGGAANREQQEQLEAQRQALAEQFGGMTALRELADQLGVSIGNAFDSKKPRDFEFFVTMLNNALESARLRIEKIQALTKSGLLATPDDLRAIAQTRGTDQEQQALIEFMQAQMGGLTRGLELFTENAPLSSEASALGAVAAIAATAEQMREMGLSAAEIARTLAPIIDNLTDKLKALGISGGEAFDRIAAHVALFTDEAVQPSIDAISGWVLTVTSLHNLGLLTEEMFQGLTVSVVEVNQALLDQGYSQEQAFLIIQPALQTMWELQTDFGFAVDEATQALIDQGVEAGIVGDKFRDPMDRMIAAVERLVSRIEDFLEALGLIGPTAEEQAGRAGRAFDGIRPPPGGGRPGGRPGEPGGEPGIPGDDPFTGPDPPKAHTGGYLWHGQVLPRFHRGGFAGDEFPILAQSGEFMMQRDAVNFWGRETLSSMNSLRAPTGGGQTIHEYHVTINAIDGPSIERVFSTREAADATARQIRLNPQGLGSAIRDAAGR